MKMRWIVGLALAAGLGTASGQTQTPANPQCQNPPNGVEAGAPPSCGTVVGFIGSDGKFHQVSSSDGLPTTGGGGGGGGAVTVAGGADVTEGTIGDTHTTGTVVGFLKDVWTALTTGPVPVSAASLPLPTGASTSANQTTANSSLSTIATNTDVPNVDVTGSGSLTVADSGSATASGQGSSQVITGSATAGSTTSFALNGRSSVAFQLSGTWSGTAQFEVSADTGTTWSVAGSRVRGASASTSTATLPGSFIADVSGQTNFRVRFITRVSGTIVVAMRASVAPGTTYVINSINTSATGYSANVTNSATAASTTNGSIKWAWVGNNNSTVCYLQVFDLATGSVTLGTTPPKYSFFLPALGGGNINLGGGVVFLTAITVAVTTTRAGASACTSGSDVNLGF